MKKNKINLINNISNFITNFAVRDEVKNGKPYLVIPIVALIEGVHCGSGGCAFYSSEEINNTAQAWNGMTLTDTHPRDNKGELSLLKDAANPVDIGSFENVRYENEKLKGEGWVDIERAESISPKTLQMIRSGEMLEVSTGLSAKADRKKGVWHGEQFDNSVSDIVPDHLALLPNEEGACSVKDGCGVRMNSKKECASCKFNKKGGNGSVKKRMIAVENQSSPEGDDSPDRWPLLLVDDVVEGLKREGFRVNELSNSKIREKLRHEVNKMDKPGVMNFLRDDFKDFFTFEKVSENEAPELFKLNFSVTKNDDIKIKGDPIPVREDINIIELSSNRRVVMQRDEQIDALIGNTRLPMYTEESREELQGLDATTFNAFVELGDKLTNCKTCNTKDADEKKAAEALVLANKRIEDLEKEKGEMTEKLSINKGQEKEELTLDESLALMNPEVRDMVQDGIRTNREKKEGLVSSLMANKKNPFTQVELEGKAIDELENLVSFGSVEVDYTPGGSRKPNTSINLNERQPNGMGVPLAQEVDWSKK